jgi:protein NrfD
VSAANRRPPYGRSPDPQPTPATYYDLPAVKASHYGWLVATYLFIGGLAGASQVIAAAAELVGGRREKVVVRVGRYLALLGSLACPLLLIKDLHTPSRWYNMLRIFRATSPMSIGSWTLAVFGTASGFLAFGQALQDLSRAPFGRRLARLFRLPAAMSGAVMSVYTGTLLSATSVPLWATGSRYLPPLFSASAVGTANAAISLVLDLIRAPRSVRRRLVRLALLLSTLELALSFAASRRWRHLNVDRPLRQPMIAFAYRFGVIGLGLIVPRAIHALQLLTGRELRAASIVASLATLAGGYVLRAVIVFAGNQSARRPEDYFRLTSDRSGLGE